jgi:hypothetical protein
MNWVDVSVLVAINRLVAERLGENAGSSPVRFDVTAKLEEKEKRSGTVVVLFALVVRTRPNVVKYEVEGNATLSGKDVMIEKLLKIDPQSKIPFVFHRIYQHVFTSIYALASLMGAIYPPPDLLLSGKQTIAAEGLDKTEPTGTAGPRIEAKPVA